MASLWQPVIATVFFSYLLGSIPWGWIIARFKGVDIRQHGSGNIGATNVLRVVGKPWGISVFVLDALKGLTAVRFAIAIASRWSGSGDYIELCAVMAAAACVVGHSFPVWLGFKGGKGVATSAGALIGVVPLAALFIGIVWFVAFQLTRYVSLASILAALSLPIAVAVMAWLHLTHGWITLYFSCAMTALVVWRHRSNIARLVSGQEPRFTRK